MADDMRLIDANSAKEKLGFAIEPFIGSATDEIRNYALLDAIKIVESMPTVDAIQREKWNELKETIIEMRDSGGTATQNDVCKFLTNLMEILEKEGKSE